jgi:hypothetical protein
VGGFAAGAPYDQLGSGAYAVLETAAGAAFVAGARAAGGRAPWPRALLVAAAALALLAVVLPGLQLPFMLRYTVHAGGLAVLLLITAPPARGTWR